jgi:hypothetical protein
MRFNFEKNIKKYGELIKKASLDLTKEGRTVSDEQKKQITEQVAKDSFTHSEAEIEIFKVQKQKIDRLGKFKKLLEKTRGENGSFVHPEIKQGLPMVLKTDAGYEVVSINKTRTSVTLGEVMTDHEWDIEYTFDASVDIHTIRNYYLEQLKSDLREKLDDQIITSETNFTRGDTAKQKAYQEIKKRMEQGSEQQGVIAEKMVKNFLKKIAIDAGSDFEILDADAFQDVESKADFIIRRKSLDKTKGAKVVESESINHPTFENIGVQFTINNNQEKQQQKERQIEKSKRKLDNMEDLVLVTLPANDAGKLYHSWLKDKTPGGPEKAWKTETAESIFRGVLSKVLTQEEINRFCEKHFTK